MRNLPRTERIRGHDAVSRLFAEGRSGVSGGIMVRALPNPDGGNCMAAVAGKKLGNAVCRNRLKRRIRAVYRLEKESLPKGWDFAVVARRSLLDASWADVVRDFHRAVERAVGPGKSAHG